MSDSNTASLEQPFTDSPLVIEELLRGEGMSLAQAAKLLPSGRGGRPVNPSCLHRWATVGAAGPDGKVIKLEVARVGCRMSTTKGAVRRFLVALNPPAEDTPRASAQASKQHARKTQQATSTAPEQVMEELRRRGV